MICVIDSENLKQTVKHVGYITYCLKLLKTTFTSLKHSHLCVSVLAQNVPRPTWEFTALAQIASFDVRDTSWFICGCQYVASVFLCHCVRMVNLTVTIVRKMT